MKTHKPSRAALTRREMLYLGAGGAAGLALAAGPGPAHGQQGKPHYGGRVRVGERFGSTGLDAHRNQAPLPQVRIYPDLAKSWETSRDGREYTFPLRERHEEGLARQGVRRAGGQP
jgi:ABC-type transport system substrate-binding protein